MASPTLRNYIASTALFQHAYPLIFLLVALLVAIPPTVLDITLHPLLYLVSPALVRPKFFFYAWRILSPLLDPGDAPHKAPLVARARDVVLEIGPGVGDNIKYYDREKVTRLVLVEPNRDMHAALREKAREAGFGEEEGTLVLLGCGGGVGDEIALREAGVGEGEVDTVVAVHVLCGVPRPALAVEMYRRLLRPGGELVFYEHVRSLEGGTARWQGLLTWTVWRGVFDGCELDRPTGEWIRSGPGVVEVGSEGVRGGDGVDVERWSELRMEAPREQGRFACTPHVMGWAVKA